MEKKSFSVIERNAFTGRVTNVTRFMSKYQALGLARQKVNALVECFLSDASLAHGNEDRLAEFEDKAWDCVEVVRTVYGGEA